MDGCTYMSLHEAIRVQLDEMELLEMAYPEVVFDQPDPRPLLRAALDEWDAGQPPAGCAPEAANETSLQAAIAGVPLVAFRCPLSSEATLRIRLPRRYPLIPLTATIEGTPSLPPKVREKILSASKMEATRFSGESRHDPHCLQVLSEATLASSDDSEDPSEDSGAQVLGNPRCTLISAAVSGDKRTDRSDGREGCKAAGWRGSNLPSRTSVASDGRKECRGAPQAATGATGKKGVGSCEPSVAGINLGRRLIYSHHIIAPQKRTGILRSARELGLGGYSKVGWPGVIVVEGEESSCEEFVRILRTWRWKHLAVRGEETQRVPEGHTIDQERRLPPIMEELSEKDGVSAVANLCRTVGLGDLFATLLR